MHETSQNPALHQSLLQMLRDLDALCVAQQLPYQLAAGTLLGAIREQNLIGWDKDADICLLRSDFDQFMRVAEVYLPVHYFLQHHASEPAFYSLVTKLRLNGSRRITDGVTKSSSMHEGIAVDIFPFDAVQPATLVGRVHMWLCANINIFLVLRTVGEDQRLWSINRSKWQQLIAWLAYQPLRLISKKRFMKSYYWLVTYYSRKAQPTGFVACLVSMPRSAAKRLPRIRPLHSFTQLTSATLAGYCFPVPHNYHDVLTNLYGDYRSPPPVAERQLGMRVEFDGAPTNAAATVVPR